MGNTKHETQYELRLETRQAEKTFSRSDGSVRLDIVSGKTAKKGETKPVQCKSSNVSVDEQIIFDTKLIRDSKSGYFESKPIVLKLKYISPDGHTTSTLGRAELDLSHLCSKPSESKKVAVQFASQKRKLKAKANLRIDTRWIKVGERKYDSQPSAVELSSQLGATPPNPTPIVPLEGGQLLGNPKSSSYVYDEEDTFFSSAALLGAPAEDSDDSDRQFGSIDTDGDEDALFESADLDESNHINTSAGGALESTKQSQQRSPVLSTKNSKSIDGGSVSQSVSKKSIVDDLETIQEDGSNMINNDGRAKRHIRRRTSEPELSLSQKLVREANNSNTDIEADEDVLQTGAQDNGKHGKRSGIVSFSDVSHLRHPNQQQQKIPAAASQYSASTSFLPSVELGEPTAILGSASSTSIGTKPTTSKKNSYALSIDEASHHSSSSSKKRPRGKSLLSNDGSSATPISSANPSSKSSASTALSVATHSHSSSNNSTGMNPSKSATSLVSTSSASSGLSTASTSTSSSNQSTTGIQGMAGQGSTAGIAYQQTVQVRAPGLGQVKRATASEVVVAPYLVYNDRPSKDLPASQFGSLSYMAPSGIAMTASSIAGDEVARLRAEVSDKGFKLAIVGRQVLGLEQKLAESDKKIHDLQQKLLQSEKQHQQEVASYEKKNRRLRRKLKHFENGGETNATGGVPIDESSSTASSGGETLQGNAATSSTQPHSSLTNNPVNAHSSSSSAETGTKKKKKKAKTPPSAFVSTSSPVPGSQSGNNHSMATKQGWTPEEERNGIFLFICVLMLILIFASSTQISDMFSALLSGMGLIDPPTIASVTAEAAATMAEQVTETAAAEAAETANELLMLVQTATGSGF